MGKKLHEHPEVYKEARQEMLRHCDGRLPPVLDPFAGGGSIPLEAARLGFAGPPRELRDSLADGHFAVHERPIALPIPEVVWQQDPLPSHHCERFAALRAVATRSPFRRKQDLRIAAILSLPRV